MIVKATTVDPETMFKTNGVMINVHSAVDLEKLTGYRNTFMYIVSAECWKVSAEPWTEIYNKTKQIIDATNLNLMRALKDSAPLI